MTDRRIDSNAEAKTALSIAARYKNTDACCSVGFFLDAMTNDASSSSMLCVPVSREGAAGGMLTVLSSGAVARKIYQLYVARGTLHCQERAPASGLWSFRTLTFALLIL